MQHPIVSRTQWLADRAALLRKEKQHTREREALADERRKLPWVQLDKTYTFTDADGEVTLDELFLDRQQLVVYHLMFGPDWDQPCPGCTQWANAFNGTTYLFEKAGRPLDCRVPGTGCAACGTNSRERLAFSMGVRSWQRFQLRFLCLKRRSEPEQQQNDWWRWWRGCGV